MAVVRSGAPEVQALRPRGPLRREGGSGRLRLQGQVLVVLGLRGLEQGLHDLLLLGVHPGRLDDLRPAHNGSLAVKKRESRKLPRNNLVTDPSAVHLQDYQAR